LLFPARTLITEGAGDIGNETTQTREVKPMSKMIRLSMLVAMAAIAIAGAAVAQDMTPEQQQAMMKAMAPGEHHKHLAYFAGTFEYTNKMWMSPGAPPMESKGTSVSKMVMGGRYLQDDVVGSAMGMPFEGMALTAYDNTRGEYSLIWIDNMGTGITRATGTCSNDGKTLTFEGTVPYPGSPEPLPFKEVLTVIDDTHHTMAWYMPGQDGEMFKTMELSYTRVK